MANNPTEPKGIDSPISGETLRDYFGGIESLALSRYNNTNDSSYLHEALEARIQLNKLREKGISVGTPEGIGGETTPQDCKSEAGITVGIIDSIILLSNTAGSIFRSCPPKGRE